jgi:AAA family ATP:ADP antiporter
MMEHHSKLAQILNIEPGEGRLVGLLFMLYFFLGVAYSFTQAAAFPIFLTEFSSRELPWVYMTSAIVVAGITFVYLRLAKRLTFTKLLSGNILFLFLMIFTFRFGLNIPTNQWIIFGLPILFQILINFGNLTFWSLAGRLLDVRQAKRLFGLVGGGQWAAIVLIGFMIPSIVSTIGIANLLVLAAGSMVLVFVFLASLTRTFSNQLKKLEATPSRPSTQTVTHTPLNRYIFSLFGLIILWWVAYYFIDNIFYAQLAIQYPNEDQLASFLGYYLAGQAFLILVINTFLAGPIINRFGVRHGLMILPVGLLVIIVSGVALGTIPGLAAVLVTLAVLSKLINMGLGFSIDLSSQNVMYQPLPPQQRVRIKMLADGIIQPVGNFLAGAALLLLTTGLALGMVQLDYILLVIVAGWLVVVLLLNREYPQMLRKALINRHLQTAELVIADETSVNILRQELQNSQPGVVLYALSTLEAVAPATLRPVIPSLLEHPSEEVRREALECIERQQMTASLSAVQQCVQQEQDPAVRGTALRALSALGGEGIVDTMAVYVHDPEPQLRMGAILGLLRNCGIEGVLVAGNSLIEMARSKIPEQRRLAAQIIGELGAEGFYDPLLDLLNDQVHEVRREAIRAAGRVRNPKLIPSLIEALRDQAFRGMVTSVLVSWGEPALPLLLDLLDQLDYIPETKIAMIDVIGRIGGERSIARLKGKMSDPSAAMRTQVLQSLCRCGYQACVEERLVVQEQIKTEAALGTKMLALISEIGGNEADSLFLDSLHDILDQAKCRIFDLLSFICEPQSIKAARLNLEMPQDNRRAYALEVLDVVVPRLIKGWVDPLWADGMPHQKVQQLKTYFPVPQMNLEQCLREVLSETDGRYSTWCHACALYTIGIHSMENLSEGVQQALGSSQPLLRETAVWTLSKLKAQPGEQLVDSLLKDPDQRVRRATKLLERINGFEGDIFMLTTLEKVIALKRAVFSRPFQTRSWDPWHPYWRKAGLRTV